MSLVGQVEWYFQVTVCARETCGMATAAAPVMAAPATNLRRVVDLDMRDGWTLMGIPSLGLASVLAASGRRLMYEPLEQVAYSDKGSLYGVTSPGTRLELSRPPRH